MRKIVTAYVNPPIPYRNNDWCAYFDDEEERGGYGYGATEKEAIADFIALCVENEIVTADEALASLDATLDRLAADHTANRIGDERIGRAA